MPASTSVARLAVFCDMPDSHTRAGRTIQARGGRFGSVADPLSRAARTVQWQAATCGDGYANRVAGEQLRLRQEAWIQFHATAMPRVIRVVSVHEPFRQHYWNIAHWHGLQRTDAGSRGVPAVLVQQVAAATVLWSAPGERSLGASRHALVLTHRTGRNQRI